MLINSDEIYNKLRLYLTTNPNVLDDLPQSTRYRYKAAFNTFHIVGGEIREIETGLIVIQPSTVMNVLMAEYTIPVGIHRLFDHMNQKYYNIRRDDIEEFISRSETAQMHQHNKRKSETRPIVVSRKEAHYQFDLIEMKDYRGYNNQVKYLLTGLDLFSKFAQVRPLTTKKGYKVIPAIEDILNVMGVPTVVQTDNGGEFCNEHMDELQERLGFKHIRSKSYTPTTQGVVERFNGTLKSMIFGYMTQNNTKKYIDALDDIILYYNTSTHSTTKERPVDVVEGGKRVQNRVHKNIVQTALNRIGVVNDALNVGDAVRLSKLCTAAQRRKALFASRVGANWSEDIYTIRTVTVPSEPYLRETYLLRDTNGNDIPTRYSYNDLLVVDANVIPAFRRAGPVPVMAPPGLPPPPPAPRPPPVMPRPLSPDRLHTAAELEEYKNQKEMAEIAGKKRPRKEKVRLDL
jgi:hypothetical protein